MIITIDGPAGSGKSTAARELAKALGIAFLDTGATYRAVTLKALRAGANLEDAAALAAVARSARIRFQTTPRGQLRVLLDGRDVSADIRLAEVTDNAHYAARAAEVRGVLVDLQRRIGAEMGSFVTEGRDQGSVVFPRAEFKFYLDASPEVRARRRCAEMLADGQQADYDQILQAIGVRDQRDRERAVSPLKRPEGAIEIDTTSLTIPEVIETLRQYVEARR
ncbi:MAG: (d)CMP kinase [Phycisphaerae bacterium]|jgi:cytidylate kinase